MKSLTNLGGSNNLTIFVAFLLIFVRGFVFINLLSSIFRPNMYFFKLLNGDLGKFRFWDRLNI